MLLEVFLVLAYLVLVGLAVCSLLSCCHVEKPLSVTSTRLEVIRDIEASRLNLF